MNRSKIRILSVMVIITIVFLIITGILVDESIAFTLEGASGPGWGVAVRKPHENSIFRHWDLREFPNCEVPFTINPNTNDDINGDGTVNNAADHTALGNAVSAAFSTWQAVNPAFISFKRTPNTTNINGIRTDKYNVLFWAASPVDDIQVIKVGQGKPNTIIIDGGTNGLDGATTLGGDDDFDGNTVISGVNGISETTKKGDDTQVIKVGEGEPYAIVITPGTNGGLETKARGDDNVTTGSRINSGANGIAQSKAPKPPANAVALGATFINKTSGKILEADIWFNDQNPAHQWNVGTENPPRYDIQVTATHEIGHIIGLHHADYYDKSKRTSVMAGTLYRPPLTPAQQAHNDAVFPNNLSKRALTADDINGCNFLYTPDLGDAEDPASAFNFYPSLVHGPIGWGTLNGKTVYKPALGAEHIFGIKSHNFQYEQIGGTIDDSPLECEARVVDQDFFDDGVTFIPSPPVCGDSLLIKVSVQVSNDADGNGHDYGAMPMYLNLWTDLNFNRDWEEGDEHPMDGLPLTTSDEKMTTILFPDNDESVLWVRARLDWGENVGRQFKRDPTLNLSRGAAQFGEVEDYPLSCRREADYTTTDDPTTDRPGYKPETWVPVPEDDRVKFPTDEGGKIWIGRKNDYVGIAQKSWTVTLKGPNADKYEAQSANGYYRDGEETKAVTTPTIRGPEDKAGPPKERKYTITLNPQPDWEVLELMRVGKSDGSDSIEVETKSHCSIVSTEMSMYGPVLRLNDSYFGVDYVDDFDIIEVTVFPDYVPINLEAPHTFDLEGTVWTPEMVFVDPDGIARPQGGIRWTLTSGSALLAGELHSIALYMAGSQPDSLYSLYAFDQLTGQYQYFKIAYTPPNPTIKIGKTHNTLQGMYEYVSITLENGPLEMGGFDFLIAYDASALAFMEATPGQLLEDCDWEYFTYRHGVQGNCGDACPSGLLRIIAIAETNDGPNHPSCFGPPDTDPHELAVMKFYVTDDRTYECLYTPIYFFWDDCGDNMVSSVDGDPVYIDLRIYDFEGNLIWDEEDDDEFPEDDRIPFVGAPDFCINPDPEKPTAIRLIDFVHGGIDIVCADSIDLRCDLNLDNIPYTVADAVMYVNYFVYGPSAFIINYNGQIAASDCNNDGKVLTVADLVYLIRVITGDAMPFPKMVPQAGSATASIMVNHSAAAVSVNSPVDLGAVQFVIEYSGYDVGEPHLINGASDMTLKYSDQDGVLKVLVYSMERDMMISAGQENIFVIPLAGEGEMTIGEVQLSDYDGNVLNSSVEKETVLPTTFALHQNYPNPFNATTQIVCELPHLARIQIEIYNVRGQKVAVLFDGEESAGIHRVEWNGKDDYGNDVASGIYFYRLTSADYKSEKKMLLMK